VDGAAGTRAATAHALGFGSRVAFLGWPTGSGTGDDRERGWREAMAAAGISAPRWTAEEDVAAARSAVEAAGDTVDAIVCASDSLAIGALLAQAAGSARVPVIGFDNTPTAEALGFSSVEQRPEDVAVATLELLMGPTGEAVTPREVQAGTAHALIEPRLVVR